MKGSESRNQREVSLIPYMMRKMMIPLKVLGIKRGRSDLVERDVSD